MISKFMTKKRLVRLWFVIYRCIFPYNEDTLSDITENYTCCVTNARKYSTMFE